MTRKSVAGLAAAAALAAVPAHAASPAAGVWLTDEGGQVEVADCGAALCGRILTSRRLAAEPALKDEKNKDAGQRGRPLRGLLILHGFTGGPRSWRGGTIYNPNDGGTYKGEITLLDNGALQLKGCIVAPMCKTQTWRRLK